MKKQNSPHQKRIEKNMLTHALEVMNQVSWAASRAGNDGVVDAFEVCIALIEKELEVKTS